MIKFTSGEVFAAIWSYLSTTAYDNPCLPH
jgi:hypothetical protein